MHLSLLWWWQKYKYYSLTERGRKEIGQCLQVCVPVTCGKESIKKGKNFNVLVAYCFDEIIVLNNLFVFANINKKNKWYKIL